MHLMGSRNIAAAPAPTFDPLDAMRRVCKGGNRG